MNGHKSEIDLRHRLEFGMNWSNFSHMADTDHFNPTERALGEHLAGSDMERKTYLDIRSGSGLLLFATHHFGVAAYSFDHDSSEARRTLRRFNAGFFA